MDTRYRFRGGRRVAQAALCGAAIAAGGCSLFNPYVHLPPPVDAKSGVGASLHGDLPAAIQRANSYRDAYYKSASEQAMFKNSLALSLIPISASALYLGLASTANASLAAGLGLGGAGLYGVGNYLYSNPRQAVYLEGARAVSCIILATRPTLVTDAEYQALSGDVDKIDEGLPGVNSAVREVVQRIVPLAGTALAVDAEAKLATTNGLVATATRVRDSGRLLLGDYDRAAIELNEHVERLAGQVNREIQKTDPDLSAIIGVVGSLSDWSGKFGSMPLKVIAPTAGGSKSTVTGTKDGPGGVNSQSSSSQPSSADVQKRVQEEALQAALTKLAEASAPVAIDTESVASRVTAAQAMAAKSGDPATCNITTVDTSFTIAPDVTDIDLPAGTSANFVISSGSTVAKTITLTPTTKDVTMNVPVNGATTVVQLAAGESAPNANPILQVSGSNASQTRTITVHVKAATANGQGAEEKTKSTTNTKTTKVDGAVDAQAAQVEKKWSDFLDVSEKKFIKSIATAKDAQRWLNKALGTALEVDGKFGGNTRDAIQKYQTQFKADLDSIKNDSSADLRILHEDTYGRLAEMAGQ